MKYLLLFLVSWVFLHPGKVLTSSYETKNTRIHQNTNAEAHGLLQRVSWYAKGLKNPQAYTTACWDTYPKGTKFKVTYRDNVVIVVCNDRGHFREMGRFLDLSSGAFAQLAPLNRGIIEAQVEEII